MKNMTPHDIVVICPDGRKLVFQPSGQIARVSVVSTRVGVDTTGIPLVKNTYGPVTGLALDEEGVPVPQIVSGMVLAALPPGTKNVFAPSTGQTAIRKDGQIIAVTELVAS
jgi:hypothetical protein